MKTSEIVMLVYLIQFVLGFIAWNKILKGDKKGTIVVSLLIIPNILLAVVYLTHHILKLVEKWKNF